MMFYLFPMNENLTSFSKKQSLIKFDDPVVFSANLSYFSYFVPLSSYFEDIHRTQVGLGTAYRNRTAVYRGTLLHTAVRTTVYRNSIKLTVIVNQSAAMGIHLIDLPKSHGV